MRLPALLALAAVSLTCGGRERAVTLDAGASCTVARHSDGDSFYCETGERVRLTGIDAPELDQGEAGRASRQALAELAPAGAVLRLETDVEPRDRYRRVLAYAWRDRVMVNREMVRRGWAVLYTVPPNVRYAGLLAAAQDTARAERAGHWAGTAFDCLPGQRRRRQC